MPAADGLDSVEDAVARIRAWGESIDWTGWDPYDGLNAPVARVLPAGLPRRLLTQAVLRAPLNVRPLLRIRPARNEKAIGLVASAYVRLAARGDELAVLSAARELAWLRARGRRPDGLSAWGYHFPVQTRVLAYPRDAPNTIATAFAAQALLEAAELLDDGEAAEAAHAAARFLVVRMLEPGQQPFFRYLEDAHELVHNANALACAVLVRTARLSGDSELADVAAAALATTLDAQRIDGSWPYAEGRHNWVDNFHTGYVLESLAACADLDPRVPGALAAGIEFWRGRLFLADGTPRYDLQRTYPLDAHCYAQAVETWLSVHAATGRGLDEAVAAASLLVEKMVTRAGWVRFREGRLVRSAVPLVRWSTAPSFRALAGVLLAVSPAVAEPARARLG